MKFFGFVGKFLFNFEHFWLVNLMHFLINWQWISNANGRLWSNLIKFGCISRDYKQCWRHFTSGWIDFNSCALKVWIKEERRKIAKIQLKMGYKKPNCIGCTIEWKSYLFKKYDMPSILLIQTCSIYMWVLYTVCKMAFDVLANGDQSNFKSNIEFLYCTSDSDKSTFVKNCERLKMSECLESKKRNALAWIHATTSTHCLNVINHLIFHKSYAWNKLESYDDDDRMKYVCIVRLSLGCSCVIMTKKKPAAYTNITNILR